MRTDTDIAFVNYHYTDKVHTILPPYKTFKEECVSGGISELLIPKPAEPSGVFVIDEVSIEQRNKAANIAAALEISMFTINLDKGYIRRDS